MTMSIRDFIKRIVPRKALDICHIFLCRSSICISNIRYYFSGARLSSSKLVPIIINNFNRLDSLTKLIASLENRGYRNIYIIDNASTYPPLLEYYDTCGYTVFRLSQNVGYKAIWQTDIYDRFKRSYYVYTDSDVLLDSQCPDDFMDYFISILEKYRLAQKVGFGIRIDDIPDHYKNKESVIAHETPFWLQQVEDSLYSAPIDTTFSLYRPFCAGPANDFQKTFRTGFPYVIQHLPWYVDSSNMSEEETYYVSHLKQSTHWSKQS